MLLAHDTPQSSHTKRSFCDTQPRRSNPPKRVTPTATKATFVYHPKGLRDPAHVSVKETGSMPGYTGYIAGNHLIAGRSFGRVSRHTQSVMKKAKTDSNAADVTICRHLDARGSTRQRRICSSGI